MKSTAVGGRPQSADAAILYTGSGRIQLRGVAITSVDLASGQPVGPDAAGRPYVVVAGLGRLDATDATFSHLGTRPTGDNRGQPAVSFGRGSTGTLTGTTFQRNSTGLVLARSQGVWLQDVTAGDSTENGIVLRGDRATVLSGVKADRAGRLRRVADFQQRGVAHELRDPRRRRRLPPRSAAVSEVRAPVDGQLRLPIRLSGRRAQEVVE